MSVEIALAPVALHAQVEAQWRPPDLRARTPDHWQRRLAIIVPYRDRAEHLQAFVKHMHDYFQHDKLDRSIPWTLHVVEQADARPFNRGALINAGYTLAAGNADYICAHDVDLLPIWADYAWPEVPARLALYGLGKQHQYYYFGGATAVSVDDYRALNGFSNGYWGWGYEDYDLRLRILASGLGIEARDGLYVPLPHERNGKNASGGESDAARRNRERFESLHAAGFKAWRDEGLNSLQLQVLDSAALTVAGQVVANGLHHRVIAND